MSRLGEMGSRLYRGESSLNIVGQRKRWYTVSAVLILIAMVSLVVRPLNLGIDFTGGAEFIVSNQNCSIQDVRDSLATNGITDPIVTELGGENIRAQTPVLEQGESRAIIDSLSQTCQVTAADINPRDIGPTWGQDIARQALIGLTVFLIAVVIFLSIYFVWQMAVAAIVALLHDLIITIGIYSLVGFEVTPATAIGLLTILGYSLYDTVVVFDKVKENTQGVTGQSRYTYSELANLALNQTLIRSINTSIVAILPVASILFVGAGLLGAGTLKDLALVLFIGLTAGTYSSIFIATPVLCQIKEREPAMRALTERVQKRRSSRPAATSAPVGTKSTAAAQAAAAGTATAVITDTDRPHRQHREAVARNQPKKTPRSKR